MPQHSGIFATVNGVSTLRNWNLTVSDSQPSLVASNTGGGTMRTQGIKKWSGSIGAYGVLPVCMPGDVYALKAYTAPDNDTLSGVGTTYAGNIMVDNIAITWNWATGEVLSHMINFGGTGPLVSTDADTAILDATTPAIKEMCPTKFQSSVDGTTFTTIPDITQGTLTISAKNTASVNSSSACWEQRIKGNIDWTLAITQQATTRAALVIGDNLQFKLFTDATLFWLLKWGRIGEYSNIKADRESGAPLERQINIGMQANVGGVLGSIVKPGAVSYWP